MTLDDDESLKGLGKFIPKTLKRIKFKLLNRMDFKKSLRCFLEEYMNNIDCDNNNGTLKYLEFELINSLGLVKYDDLVVTEQFGIQITEQYI